MTRQTSIQLTPETQAQIDALGERGFGTQSNIIRTAIKRMYQQETQTVTYLIDERMLGDEASEEDAHRMVELLRERGYGVEYGHAISQDEDTIPTAVWEECLDIISREKYPA